MPQNMASDQGLHFALSTGVYIKHGDKKNNHCNGYGLIQRTEVEESTWHIWIDKLSSADQTVFFFFFFFFFLHC